MDSQFDLQPASRIRGQTGYGVPRPSAPCELWLHSNEGPAPDASLLQSLAEEGSEILRRYPESRDLENLLAERHGVHSHNLIVTAGVDEALDRICRAVLEPGRELILAVPSFEMFEQCTRMAGGTLVEVPWLEGPYPVQQVIEKIGDKTAVIAVVSPNNPTGLVARREDLEQLSAAAPNALLVVDLAYTEFAEVDLMPAVLALPNALALRTLSKAWGLAGLRVGYAVGPAEVIAWLHRAGGPFPVAQVSRFLAMGQLREGEKRVRTFVDRVRVERGLLFDLLSGLGAEPVPSQGNFVLARPDDPAWVADGLAGLGIAVRSFPDRPLLANALRITCPGNCDDWERLEHGLRTVMTPAALLFDMDGVLADVSGSYRKAILETARSFGIQLTAEDVTAAKAAGNANNDWELTHALLASHGKQVPFEDVKQAFESRYQGTDGRAGLWESERLLCPVEVLQELGRTLPLAVVTGRPRSDTLRFLEHQGIASLFQTLVCLEDGPTKPDPAPVALALQNLGVRHAWMVGDTPDDIRAARGAGVLPLALVAPGDDSPLTRDALTAAGAARILDSVRELVLKQRGKKCRVDDPDTKPAGLSP